MNIKKTGMKKIIAGALASVLTLTAGIIPQKAVLSGTIKTGITASAEEVPKGYTAIHNIEELYAINNDLYGNYILMNDIDMTKETAPGGDWDNNGTGWEPIGLSNSFEGIFDGNGHAIIGMNIHGDVEYRTSYGDTYYKAVGLFRVNGGTIKNLKMLDVNIDVIDSGFEYDEYIFYREPRESIFIPDNSVGDDSHYNYCVGGIVSMNVGIVENCFVTGNITLTEEVYIAA